MIEKILELSKIFIKDYIQKLDIFDAKKKKLNKKSPITWLLIISVCGIAYISYKIIGTLSKYGQEVLFLKIYFPVMATIFMFQSIVICSNVFFFSKDLEYILPLPIKPIELLIAKFNNVISVTYSMELLFLAVPLVFFGLLTMKSFIYYFIVVLVLIIFPIFLITIICIIMLFIMQLTKFIKNKDIFQIIIVLLLSFMLTTVESYIIKTVFSNDIINIEVNEDNSEKINNKLDSINNFFVVINPCINLLTNISMKNICFNLLKLIFLCTITFAIFILFGKILYIKNLLKNIAYINKKKNNKKIIKNKYKKNKIRNSYVKNEINKLIKNPTFFIQCFFQYIFIAIIILFLINSFIPTIITSFKEKNIINEIGKDNFYLQCICLIVEFIQIIFTLNNMAITSISRDGKDALFMKYIPVPLYKQFLWKNVLSVVINIVPIIGVAIIVNINVENVPILFYLCVVAIAMLLNIINSFLMTVVDLKKPNLNWVTETSALKDNTKKLYQYVLSIVIVLFFMYFTRILEDVDIAKSILLIILILFIIFLFINYLIKRNINKIYKEIK